jgi:hypothetical protein
MPDVSEEEYEISPLVGGPAGLRSPGDVEEVPVFLTGEPAKPPGFVYRKTVSAFPGTRSPVRVEPVFRTIPCWKGAKEGRSDCEHLPA